MYEDTALHINKMKKKEDIAMQSGNLLEKTKPNCIFMTWLRHHHWRNHYSYDVIRITRSSTNLYLYYFIIKCNLFIKILQHGKNAKNMKNYKFPKISRCFQQNSHCRTSESYRTLNIFQNMSTRYKLKVKKTHPAHIDTFWNFSKSLSWVGGSFNSPPSPPHLPPPEVEIGLNTAIKARLTFLEVKIQTGKYNCCI